MASFKNLISNTSAQISSGGTITGDLVINGDLQVDGGGSLSFDEIVQGTQVIDVTNTEALLVRKNDDGGDVFVVDTTNSKVSITDTLNLNPTISSGSKTSLAFQRSGTNKWRFIQPSDDSYLKLYNDQASATQMYFKSDNKIGIGTDSPSAPMEIYSTNDEHLRINNPDGGWNYINFNHGSTTEGFIGTNGNEEVILGSTPNNPIVFIVQNAERARITNTGLGIGTSSPDAPLEIETSTQIDKDTILCMARITGHSNTENSGSVPSSGTSLEFYNSWSNGSPYSVGRIAGRAYQGYNGGFQFDVADNSGAGQSNFTTALSISPDTNATFAGDVTSNGNILSQGASAPSISVLDTTNNASIQMRALDSEVRFGTTSNHPVKIGTNNSYDVIVLGTDKSATFGGDIAYSGTNNLLKTSTSDGSDNASITIDSGGGGQSRVRGAYIALYGNEHSNGGIVDIQTGNDSGAKITFRTGDGGTRMIIDANSRISLSNNDSGTSNTVFGKLAGDDLASGGNYNSLFGESTGGNTTGDYNVAIGMQALKSLPDGDKNVAIGVNAMEAQDDTANGLNDCVAIGFEAFQGTNAGTSAPSGTVAIGSQSLKSLTSGAGNVAVGYESLNVNTNGNQSTAIGHQALKAQTGTSGEVANTAVGYQAGLAITTGIQNTALGSGALKATDDGGSNTAIGAFTMGLGNAGGSNTAVGGQCLVDVTGSNNVAVGFQTLFDLTSGGENIGIGHSAGKLMNGAEAGNTIIGIGSMADANNDSTSKNVAVGNYTLNDIGTNAQVGLVAIGYEALRYLTSGVGNTAVGFESLKTENDGSRNTAIGYKALTTLNTSAGNGETTAIGFEAGMDVSTGIANTFVGSRAGNQGTNDITTGSNNTMIGKEARGSANSASNQTVIGASATGVADNSVTLGNGDVTAVYMAQDKSATMLSGEIEVVQASGVNAPVAFIRTENSSDYSSSILTIQGDRTTTNNTYNLANFTNAGTPKCVITDGGNLLNTNNSYGAISDEKLKQDIEDANSQWDDIKAVRFRKFKFKDMVEDGFKLGVVAQELEKVSPSLISEAIDRDVDGKDLGTTTKSVKYSILQMKGIVALQEALNRIETLEAKVKELESK